MGGGKLPHRPEPNLQRMNALPGTVSTIDLCVVIPAHNEEENLPTLYHELCETLGRERIEFTVLFVDDGSLDSTSRLIRELSDRHANVRGLILSRNFGHQAAISIGLQYATARTVAVMDADLQDRPADLVKLYQTLMQNRGDVAYAIRRTRKEGALKQVAYKGFYRTLNRVARVQIPLDSGDFCVMSSSFVEKLNALPERLRFVRGLRAWLGGKQLGVPVDRDSRHAGVPQYTLWKLVRLAADGLISFSDAPLRLATLVGFAVSGTAFVGVVWVLTWKLTGALPQGAGLATIALSVLFLGGIQLVAIGILGEYVGRLFEEVKRRPTAVVAEIIGQDE
jgi:glycosyltransferase involved in cell wall biosynthesis